MIHADTLRFLKQLKKNNNKPWFEENRDRYEAAKKNVLELAATFLQILTEKDIRYAELDPKKCLFRINRDIRFSKDKTPYKTHMGLYFNPGGKKDDGPGYYLHIGADELFFAAGIWMPPPEQLKAIRQEIDYNWKDFKKIIDQKTFKDLFGTMNTEEKLQRPPKGYEETNPAIEYLKLKSFTISGPVPELAEDQNAATRQLKKLSVTARPFLEFLRPAIDD